MVRLRRNKSADPLDLGRQYARATAAVADFGLVECDGQPTPNIQAVRAALSPEIATWLAARAHDGVADRLVIAPLLGSVTLMQLQTAVHFEVYRPFWDKYTPDELNSTEINPSRLGDTSPPRGWQTSVLLCDTRDPLEPERVRRRNDSPGLAYVGLSLIDQRARFETERHRLSDIGIVLEPATVAQLLMVEAQCSREKDFSLVGSVRLIQLPVKREEIADRPTSPLFEPGHLTHADPGAKGWVGVRRTIRLDIAS
jgi:hypothetical protein